MNLNKNNSLIEFNKKNNFFNTNVQLNSQLQVDNERNK